MLTVKVFESKDSKNPEVYAAIKVSQVKLFVETKVPLISVIKSYRRPHIEVTGPMGETHTIFIEKTTQIYVENSTGKTVSKVDGAYFLKDLDYDTEEKPVDEKQFFEDIYNHMKSKKPDSPDSMKTF